MLKTTRFRQKGDKKLTSLLWLGNFVDIYY